MKTLIVYHSEHHMNTEKIANIIAQVLDAEVIKSMDISVSNIQEYDIDTFFLPTQKII